jgi:predicted nucleic acid-binding protein
MVDHISKIVVSDTTAITYLAKINELPLLRNLFKIIYIPEAVFHELTRQGDHIPGSKEVKTFNWIRVKKTNNMERVKKLFNEKLHPGESEAIGLALQMNAHLLIMDERDGRKEAINQGLKDS